MKPRVIVIGGGLAGLSAATALAEQSIPVTLLEGRQVLGGRAFSFLDPKTGDTIDNGQHLFMGCYLETQQLLKRIGTLEQLHLQSDLTVDFVGENFQAKLKAWPLPPPLHLLIGLLNLSTLSWKERLRLAWIRVGVSSAKKNPASVEKLTVSQWLTRWHQSERSQKYLWDLIAIATLNEDPKIAAAGPFVTVLDRAFFGSRRDAQLGYASVGLSDLYVTASEQYLKERGAEIYLKSPVEEILIQDSRVTGVRLRDGRTIEADWVISTVQPHAMVKMLPKTVLDARPELAQTAHLSYAPILSITVWFDRPITDASFVGMLDTEVQWCFDKTKLYGGHACEGRHAYALVISGAHRFIDWDEAAVTKLALDELHRLMPASRDARLIRSLVVKEHKATLSPTVGSDALRPAHPTAIPGFLLAGDWTQTGLPATIESACQSGHTCAKIITSSETTSGENRHGQTAGKHLVGS